jgi:hypothetical protein
MYKDGLKLSKKESEMRDRLLKEERAMRRKQPIGWAKGKYRAQGIYNTVFHKVVTDLGYDKKNLTNDQRMEISREVSRILATLNKDDIYTNSDGIVRV